MDSQALGALAAAIITALAGLAGVAMTRRTSFDRQQLQTIREEAELLALLPADHPMRDRLSSIIAIRIVGYGRVFEVNNRFPRRSWPFVLLAMVGPVLSIVMGYAGGWSAMWRLLGDALTGETITALEWRVGLAWWGVCAFAVAAYFVGLWNLIRRGRERIWARAMQLDQQSPRSTLAEMAQGLSWLWSQVASAARAVWSLSRKDGGREAVNDDPRGSEADS